MSVRQKISRLSRGAPLTRSWYEFRIGALADERAPLHDRLDVIERYLAHLAEQGDRNTRTTTEMGQQVEQHLVEAIGKNQQTIEAVASLVRDVQIRLDQLTMEIVERVDSLAHAGSAPLHGLAPAEVARVAGFIGSRPSVESVLVVSPRALAAALAVLPVDVCHLSPLAEVQGRSRAVSPAAASSRSWDVVVVLDGVCDGLELDQLVRPEGAVVTRSSDHGMAVPDHWKAAPLEGVAWAYTRPA